MILRIFIFLILLINVYAGFNSNVCKKTKHCVSVPSNCHEHNNEECDYIVGYSPTNDNKFVEIELYGKKPGADYVALGFSEDELMGNDAVTACYKTSDGSPKLLLGYNPNKWNQKLESWTNNDAKLIESAVDGDSIYCKFIQSVIPSNAQLPDFDKSYQLLVAMGPLNGENLGYHSTAQAIPDFVDLLTPVEKMQEPEEIDITDPNISNVKNSESGTINFVNTTMPSGLKPMQHDQNAIELEITTKAPENTDNPIKNEKEETEVEKPAQRGTGPFSLTGNSKIIFIRFHGLFMLIGWFAMIAVGIFSARYLRGALPEYRIGRLHAWFQLHRIINFTAILMIILASILVFIAKDLRWTGPLIDAPSEYNLGPGAIHSLVGVIAVGLCILQPLFALCRCGPDHPKRFMFNWGHRSIGIIGILLALIAAFIAILRFKSLWPTHDWHIISFILYTAISALIIIGLEVYDVIRLKHRQNYSINAYELQGRGKYQNDVYEANFIANMHERQTKDKFINLLGYFIFIVISIATVVFLGIFLF